MRGRESEALAAAESSVSPAFGVAACNVDFWCEGAKEKPPRRLNILYPYSRTRSMDFLTSRTYAPARLLQHPRHACDSRRDALNLDMFPTIHHDSHRITSRLINQAFARWTYFISQPSLRSYLAESSTHFGSLTIIFRLFTPGVEASAEVVRKPGRLPGP